MKSYYVARPLSGGTPRRAFPKQADAEGWARDAAALFGRTYRVYRVHVVTRRRLVREFDPASTAALPPGRR